MLYLFIGDDAKRKLQSLESFLASLGKNKEIFSVSRNNFSEDEIESFISGSGLFAKKFIIVFKNILENVEAGNFLSPRLDNFKNSESHFIFLEEKLSKVALDAFKKSRAELNIFELPAVKKEKFNNFILANALGERNKLNLWINFRRAISHGVTLEELSGVLFWKAKDMILRKDFSKLSQSELKDFAAKLSVLLPQTRNEGRDSEAAMEEFLLRAF